MANLNVVALRDLSTLRAQVFSESLVRARSGAPERPCRGEWYDLHRQRRGDEWIPRIEEMRLQQLTLRGRCALRPEIRESEQVVEREVARLHPHGVLER